ncbi:MAG: hypothetical protein JXB30_00570 [Anaerolineae bacterium]|nr:hypothetical protein [Anaerolineae bacterium]
MGRSDILTLLAAGLLSAAMLVFELTLTRLFAVAQFYHFAFMAISVALLGSGAAGSLLTVWPRLGKRPGLWSASFSLATLAGYGILNLIPFDSYAIAWDHIQILYLILTFAGATLPFLGAGLVIGGLMSIDAGKLHRVYAANLIGSALGCVIALPLLAWLGGEGALLAGASMGLVASALFGYRGHIPGGQRARSYKAGLGKILPLIGAILLVAAAVVQPAWLRLRLSPYKALSQALLAPTARHTFSEWGIVARVDVVESDSIHVLPGLSQNALIERPPLQAGLTLDADNLMPITALDPGDDLAGRLAANVPEAIIGELRPNASMLVLEPGGGWDVLMMLADGARSVTAIERNPLVIHALGDTYAGFTHDLYNDPRVQVIRAEGRAYLRQHGRAFDVILFALSDTFHPVTSGAYGLTEDYRYTVEAVDDMLSRLEPDGLLVITRWLQTPPTESARTLAIIEAALRARQITYPADHIAAFRSMRTITFIVSPEPLAVDELARVREFVNTRGYDLVWLPGISADEVNLHNIVPVPLDYRIARDLLADPQGTIEEYEYDICPPTDDRPFFHHYFRWRQTPEIVAGLGRTWQPFGGSGYLVLVALLALVTVLAALLIFGPLVTPPPSPLPASREGEKQPEVVGSRVKLCALLYFSMLGLGFLFIEMPLAQRFILFVGQPVTALAVVLFAVLLFSGLGSLTAPRWRLRWALAALIGMALLMPPLLTGLFRLALGWPAAARIGIAVLSLAPLGLLMGVPFARGMALIEQRTQGIVPWAWAVNGSTSVIAAVLAVMIAVSWGFSAVLWVGAGTYAVALGAIFSFDQQKDQVIDD